MENYYGDTMLLKELIQLTGVNINLSKDAEKVEVSDDYYHNYSITSAPQELSIICAFDDILRTVNFNFNKNTITDLFVSEIGHGGVVYSINGELLKIIN